MGTPVPPFDPGTPDSDMESSGKSKSRPNSGSERFLSASDSEDGKSKSPKPKGSPVSSEEFPEKKKDGDKKKDLKKDLKKSPDSPFSDMGKQARYARSYHASGNEDEFSKPKKKKAFGRSARAGLIFPVTLTRSVCKMRSGLQFGMNTSVYIASATETILAEIMSTAANIAKERKAKTITPRHIALAIQGDDDMKQLIKATIPGGGVQEHIHPALTPAAKKGVRKDRPTKSGESWIDASSSASGVRSNASSSSIA